MCLNRNYLIGSRLYGDILYKELRRQVDSLNTQGYNLVIKSLRNGPYVFYEVKYNCDLNYKSITEVLSLLSETICALILDRYKEIVVNQKIRSYFYYFNYEDKQSIGTYAIRKLESDQSILQQERWKKSVIKRILSHFQAERILIIDGFINFKMKDFCKEIEIVVEEAVDDFVIDKEYEEYIKLLQTFVKSTPSKFETVHVFFFQSGGFRLYNDKMDVIDIDSLIVDLVDNDVNYEDLLISSLISAAPGRLVLHGSEGNKVNPNETIITIDKVFNDKVAICEGCHKCSRSVH